MYNDHDLDEILNEALGTTSVIRVKRQSKIKRLVGKVAIRMAKKRNDTAYAKYRIFRMKMLEQKHRIMMKYARRALVVVKRGMNHPGQAMPLV